MLGVLRSVKVVGIFDLQWRSASPCLDGGLCVLVEFVINDFVIDDFFINDVFDDDFVIIRPRDGAQLHVLGSRDLCAGRVGHVPSYGRLGALRNCFCSIESSYMGL